MSPPLRSGPSSIPKSGIARGLVSPLARGALVYTRRMENRVASDLTPAQRIREEAKEATRRALLEGGLALTIELDGEIPTIDAVVARAGYTRGAFYFHFTDREDFVAQILEWVLADILSLIFAAATEGAGTVQEVVVRFNDAMARREWPDLHGDIRAGYMAILRELRHSDALRERHAHLMHLVVAQLDQLIRDGQTNGTLRSDLDSRHTATLLVLSAIGSIMWDNVGIDIDNRAVGEVLIRALKP